MNKIKFLSFLSIVLMLVSTNVSFADTIGYADFQKVSENYIYAQKAAKEIDDKVLALEQFRINKGKEFKAIESPVSKKNFEEKVQKEYNVKYESLLKFKTQKEIEIINNIQSASKVVSAKKKVDVVFDKKAIMSGGIDLTQDIITYLNSNSASK